MATSRDRTEASAPSHPTRFSSRIASRQSKSNKEEGDRAESGEEESNPIDEELQSEADLDAQHNDNDSLSGDDPSLEPVESEAVAAFKNLTKASKGAVVRRVVAEANANTAAPNPNPYAAFDIKLDSDEAKNIRKAHVTGDASDDIQKPLVQDENLDKPPVDLDYRAIVKRFCQAMVDTDSSDDGPVEDGNIFRASRPWERFRAKQQDAREVEAHMWLVVEAAVNVHNRGGFLLGKDKGKKVARPKQGCEPLKFWDRISAIEDLLKRWKLVWPDVVAGGPRLQTLVQMPEYAGRLKGANQQNNRVRHIGRQAGKPAIWRHIKMQVEQDRAQNASGDNIEENHGEMSTEEAKKGMSKPAQGTRIQPSKLPLPKESVEHQHNLTDENLNESIASPSVRPPSWSSTTEFTAKFVDIDGTISSANITEARLQRLETLNRSDSPHGSLADYLRREHGSPRIDGEKITPEAIQAEIEKLRIERGRP